jgi:hypothetical protein
MWGALSDERMGLSFSTVSSSKSVCISLIVARQRLGKNVTTARSR